MMSKGVIKKLSEACITGNLDLLLQVIYYNRDSAQELICEAESDGEESPNHNTRNFLSVACENGHLEVVRKLVDFGADVNHASYDYLTPLCAACMNGHTSIAKFLISSGALVHDPALGQSSPILLACRSGNHDIIELLLSERPLLLRTHGQLLLYETCRLGHVQAVRLLIKKGVDINPSPLLVTTTDAEARVPGVPLQGACVGQQTSVVNYLIENGAEVTPYIVEKYWELVGEALMRYTKETQSKKKAPFTYEADPSVTTFSAAWNQKNLFSLHKAWFVNLSARLVSVDLSDNHIEELPEELFNTLPLLEVLDVSKNKLLYLPEVTSTFTRLQKLRAFDNEITFVPSSLLQIPTLKKLHLARNKITSLCGDPNDIEDSTHMPDSETWGCTALKILNLSGNQLQHLPGGIQGTSSLTKLFLDHNKLKEFPMPWKSPLQILDLSHNKFTHFSCNVDMVWATSLKRLNLANNNLGSISWSVCQLACLQDLDVSHNALKHLPKPEFWTSTTMHKLNLSYNKLTAKPLVDPQVASPKRFPFFKLSGQEETHNVKTDCEFPISLFSPTLETLLLNDNNLQVVPLSVCRLMSLIELDLSNNLEIRTLPPELGNLRECWQLRLNKLNLPGLPKHVRPGENGVRSKDTMAYLRATLRKSVPYYRMKLMVVGMQGRGKTTLLAALRGQKLPPNLSTVGIVIDEWQVQISSSSRFTLQRFISQSDAPMITFSTWDLAGQSVYYAAHQMFLSPNTLYLAVWNVTHGEEGVESLRRWLLNIQARAPFSEVLIVGTHVDLLPKSNRQARVDALKHSIAQKYLDNQGFPKIVGNIMVSPVTGENIPELKEMIYSKALKVKDNGENIIGRRVPQSYTELQQAIIQEAERRRSSGEPPILLEDEVLQLAKSSPHSDILNTEELTLATRFLHENGVLLHYNDQLRGLNHLYFIDARWVCELIATLVTIRERNPFIMDGVMKMKDLELVLRDPKFPQQFIPQYLQLMERFEIALSLNDKELLIPSMLPKEKPGMQLHQLQKMIRKTSDEKTKSGTTRSATHPEDWRGVTTVRRNYQMAYIPSGFWSRLITRLIVSVQRWRTIEQIKEECYSLVYWREGIGVVYEGGHFQVESYQELVPLNQKATFQEISGIAITVWSEQHDFAAVGFIVDQIDALITEWYPGLDETDMYGMPLVRRLIPCPMCTGLMMSHRPSMKRSVSMEFPATFHALHPPRPYNFTLSTCAATALDYSTMSCPYHPDKVVPFRYLIPDLLMADLPRHFLLDESEFKFEALESHRIGGGGSGEVYWGLYRDEAVAIKTFHSTKVTKSSSDSGFGETKAKTLGRPGKRRMHFSEGSCIRRSDAPPVFFENDMEEELEKTKVVKAFWDLRQEVAVLCRLKHPCVVRLVGVSLHPLCFVLELAPHGSLATVIDELSVKREERAKQQDSSASNTRGCLLGRELSYKIVFQVASAIWYLHDCDIIYRDLKADNVLVWSLDDNSLLNVKLSDYGISCFATPQGVAGEEGTPGYQAPEIRTGAGYDEKVDIFSFAIFVFELLSGCRPFREYRNVVDIKKAIRRGVRPSLESCDLDIQLPRLEGLMRTCWHQLPEKRPPAEEIVQQLEKPGFLCQCRLVPESNEGLLEKVTTINGLSAAGTPTMFPSPEGSSSSPSSSFVLLWSRERDNRSYSMVNAETGIFYAHDEKCTGHRVLCITRVENRTWLGTEGCTVEVFGRKSWRAPSTLWFYSTKAPVLALLTEYVSIDFTSEEVQSGSGKKVKNVYASLANGTLVVFAPRNTSERRYSHADVTMVTKEEDEFLSRETSKWSNIQVVNLGQSGTPAKSMVLVRDNKELWVGCGNKIVIVDTNTLILLDEIVVYQSHRTHVRIMVTDGERVWSGDRRSTKILQWDVNNRQLTHIFECDVDNPVGQVLCSEIKEPRRSSDKKTSMGRTRRRRVSDPTDSLDQPSYTEAMLREAMTDLWNKDDQESDSHSRKDSHFRDSEKHLDDVLDSTVRTVSYPVPIPGSEVPVNIPSNDTDSRASADSGVSSFLSANITTNTATSSTSDAARTKVDTQDDNIVATETYENVIETDVEIPMNNTQYVSKNSREERKSDVEALSRDELSRDSTVILTDESKATNTDILPVKGTPPDSESVIKAEHALTEENPESTSGDDNTPEGGTNIDPNKNEADFDFMDRDKSRKAFIEAKKKNAPSEEATTHHCLSMDALQNRFRSSFRAPSLMSSQRRKSQRRKTNEDDNESSAGSITKPWARRPRLRILAGSINRVTSLLIVNGTLWIGRGVGDVLTVNVNSANNGLPHGHVFAQLVADNLLGYENGQVDEIVNSGTNKVVCLRRLEVARGIVTEEERCTERYQLVVWEAWGDTQFKKFKDRLDHFNSLVN
ncbi:leucine-rich repeat serine/threonine-protein kinase 1-like isoform X3 [Montipora capricornis]|uniref:leucine-rich repeat serine/threonine-protein kinase 1-like isoform X3 n=1 Tax=Montipora capricornis TaxID=246305 RepID=UPI0035F11DF0